LSSFTLVAAPTGSSQKFKHISGSNIISKGYDFHTNIAAEAKDTLKIRDIDELLEDISLPSYAEKTFIPVNQPRVYSGYKHINNRTINTPEYKYNEPIICGDIDSNSSNDSTISFVQSSYSKNEFSSTLQDRIRFQVNVSSLFDQLEYSRMIEKPESMEYAYWDLPVPPTMPEQDTSFAGFLSRLNLPAVDKGKADFSNVDIAKTHWLHVFNTGLQFSQAYLSPNWYQGGNNNLSLLFNFLWDVNLNQVYHPNLLFSNSVSYKLGLVSTPRESVRNYTISEDLFQWNLKAGIKAVHKWFYSLTLQFKTQLLNNYDADYVNRIASFMSSGDLNVGIGMTYSTNNASKSLKFNASLSPISYNLKTCLDSRVDPTLFNIKAGKKTLNEIGSNAELTLDWSITKNITYKSRLFLFSNYQSFLGDWENTLSFAINRFLSTQIYFHARYDSESEITNSTWKHWMLKEILSFGLAYSFSTK
jgi:hypothetical protein